MAPTASAHLRIKGEMTIYRAHELKQMLIEPLQAHARVEVDLAEVTDIDTAGLQVLMLAKRTAQQCGTQLCLAGHSPAVLEVLELLNLAGYFGDPLVMAPCSNATKE